MLRRTPSTTRNDTPFPYTTLFRSVGAGSSDSGGNAMSETQAAEAAAKAPDTRPDTRQVGAGELKDLAAKPQDLLKIRTLPIGMKQIETVEAMEAIRSDERRVGKECGSTCRSRWSPDP